MHAEGFFAQAFVYLLAAVVSVPIAKRLGLGSVLGYLLAGVAIGPYGLGFVAQQGQDLLHFAEFGVVMMLFLVGLELEPSLLWRLRAPILGLGGLQVAVTAAAVAGLSMALGLGWKASVAVGLTLSLSSTAIVLQTLGEKGLLKTSGGQSSFAVLLFQDIAVIPMLAVFPLLAVSGAGPTAPAGGHGTDWVHGLPAWAHTLAVVATVAAVVLAGRFLVRPALRAIARTRQPEVFTAAALLLVIAIALLMTRIGLSPALGTFLAGVVLANSEYRHELESDIAPFKGLLLGLFFLAVGASIDFGLVAARPGLIAGLVAGLMVVKFGILAGLGAGFRLGTDQNLLFAVGLCQMGEFGFVLLSFAAQQGVLGADVASPLVAVVALSMALTPLLFLANEKLLQPRLGTRQREERRPDAIHEDNPVIIAGFGRFGHVVGRLLRANGIGATVLDLDSDRVDLLRKVGLPVFYGDATRPELLRSAGADKATLLVLALDNPEKTLALVHLARKHFPHLTVLARAADRPDAYELLEAGVSHVYRETFDTSLRMAVDALRLLGFQAPQAQRASRTFFRHDEDSVRAMAAVRQDHARHLLATRESIADLERLLLAEREEAHPHRDAGWDADSCTDAEECPSDRADPGVR